MPKNTKKKKVSKKAKTTMTISKEKLNYFLKKIAEI
jgi:hypothetical protein